MARRMALPRALSHGASCHRFLACTSSLPQGMLEIRSYRSFVSRYYSATSGYDGHNHHHHHRNGDHMKSKARVEQEKITGGEYYHDEHPKSLGVPALEWNMLHKKKGLLIRPEFGSIGVLLHLDFGYAMHEGVDRLSRGYCNSISKDCSFSLFTWVTCLLLMGFGAMLVTVGGYFIYHRSERQSPIKARKPDAKRLAIDKSTLGGTFSLVNQAGEVVTDQTLMGHWTLVYFGYTSCPEDCPQELEKLAQVIEMIDAHTEHRIQPVFITIDPKRDSPSQLQAYLSEFHPKIIGLTGSVDDIRQVARQYRVFYKKVEEEGSDYLIDHSNLLYLMDPTMKFVKFFGKEYDSASVYASILKEIL